MNMHQSNRFEAIYALGYHRLVPIIPPGAPISERSSLFKRAQNPGTDPRGKSPGVRWPDGSWSGYDFVKHESEPADLPRWADMGAGIGIKTGQGLALIDADTMNEDHAKTIQTVMQSVLGFIPPLRIGRAPKAGYLIRVMGEFQYARVEFGERDAKGRLKDRVEILYEGRQFVAEGIHPTTLQPYRWPDGLPPIDDVPIVLADQLMQLLSALRDALPSAGELVIEGAATDVDQHSLQGDLALVRAAVSAIPNDSDHFPSRESYVAMGYAIKAALPDHQLEAFEIYADWCERWQDGDNDVDVVESEWRRMKPPYRRGASWLYSMATDIGDGTFRDVDRWADADGSMQFSEADAIAFKSAATVNGERRFTLVPFNEAAASALETSAEPLVEGLLDQGAMTVLYGESNAGKTFASLSVCYHIARGLPWGGMDVTPGRVVYIAAEGGLGIRKRAAALRAALGDDDGRFLFLIHPINLLRADADVEPLIGTLRDLMADGAGLAMLVVDTLSRAMAGGDENGSTDMGAIVRNLDRVRAATAAHLMVVHHSGKDRAKGARGHSLLRAATDTEIEVADGAITVTKQRDIEARWSSGFVIESRDIGHDRKGRVVASGVLRLVSGEAVSVEAANITARERDIMDAIHALDGMADEGKAGVPVPDLVAYFDTTADKLEPKAVRFHLNSLLAKKVIERVGRGKYSLKRQFVPSYHSSYHTDCPKPFDSDDSSNDRETVASLLD